MLFTCNMERDVLDYGIVIKPFYFYSHNEINLRATDENEIYDKMIDRIEEEIQKLEAAEGTGWRLHSVIKLELFTVEWVPLRGSSYIKLPEYLRNKNAIINMKNMDNKCFLWSVLRALNPLRNNGERIDKISKYKENTLNMKGIKYPVSLKDINKFESLNSNISITVYGYNKKDKVYPLGVSPYKNRDNKIDLLLIEDGGKSHYCLINDLSRLISMQVSKHCGECFLCDNCLKPFKSKESLDKHKEYCYNNECVKINMPEKGSILKFKNFCKSERMPFTVYADTESLLNNIQNCEPDPEKSYTNKYQKHVPISFSYYIKCFDDNVYEPKLRSYTGEDAMEKFVEWLERDVREIAKIPYKDMGEFTPELLDQYEAATKCCICKKDLNGDKVRDHCHFTGKYRGAAHNECNLNYKNPKNIPVIRHNLSGYDSHLFIKNLGFTEGDIDCIANNDEKYITFSKNVKVDYMNREKKYVPGLYKIRFVDSLKFMNESLDELVNNLPGDAFKNLEKYYSGDKLNLVKRKGVYPYDYMDTEERLKEKCLPPKEAFYSKLSGRGITDKDYEHAKNVWDVFEIKTLGDYHNLYNKTDVLLLADVFENFRNICLEHYGLDPAHYLTAPGLAWDACLKMTGVNLELLSDVDMLLMVEREIRGGVSMISNRYGRANNKYMGDSYVSSLASTFLAYLDANNLYGVAMSMKLPTHGFKWMSEEELNVWRKIPCILEVDLEYPKELHDLIMIIL